MNKPNGYDEATAFTGEYETIILGGHKAIITDAYEQNYNKDGNSYSFLIIEYDFDKGDKQEGYFSRKYQNDSKKPTATWKGTYRQGIPKGDGSEQDNRSMSFFKGVITAIEESNTGYKFDWDPASLKGKRFAAVMGREEFTATDGKIRLATKCVNIRSLSALESGKIDIPKIKLLDGSRIDEDDYEETTQEKNGNSTLNTTNEFTTIKDDDLPF